MTNLWKKLAALAFLLFLALWVAGFLRTFAQSAAEAPTVPTIPVKFSSISEEYGSSLRQTSNLAQMGLPKAPLPQVLDQVDIDQLKVYEKTGQISSGSTNFTDDEERVRKAIVTHKSVIFDEKASGIAPERKLSLGISVPPERFDSLLEELTHVGQLRAINVEQKDRTGEFRRLHAQRQSLKKYQEAILKLRVANKPSIDDALKLEQKILEIEKDIQTLGVQLGDLLGKEPFYNLFIAFQEYPSGSRLDRTLTVARRLESGFIWAIGWWFMAILGLGLLVATYVSIQTLRPTRSTVG